MTCGIATLPNAPVMCGVEGRKVSPTHWGAGMKPVSPASPALPALPASPVSPAFPPSPAAPAPALSLVSTSPALPAVPPAPALYVVSTLAGVLVGAGFIVGLGRITLAPAPPSVGADGSSAALGLAFGVPPAASPGSASVSIDRPLQPNASTVIAAAARRFNICCP